MRGFTKEIDVIFATEQQLSGKLADSSSTPAYKILLNEGLWKKSSRPKHEYALKRECCYLMACKKMGRVIKKDGVEYRYFAFKTGTIEPSSRNSFRDDFTILTPEQW
jgi:hypothetical protein